MALSSAQIGACFQSYWYMWMTNGISGLLFMGIQIGIAAFFMKKFGKKKPKSTRHRPRSSVNNTRRTISPSEITTFDDPFADGFVGHGLVGHDDDSRNPSAVSQREPGLLEDNEEFAQSTLNELNGIRRRYNAAPLEINEQISQIAQRWAEQMARSGRLEHSPVEWRSFDQQTLGENYSASFQAELTGERMAKKWMKEGKRYMFGFDGRKDTENFTQLVWRTSQEIGVGRARSEDGNWWYGVVMFNPPGNIPNQYANNVFLPPE